MNRSISTLSRRSFLAGTAGVLGAPMVFKASPAAAKSNSVTITGPAGSWLETLEKYVFKPFTEETGIKVNVIPGVDLAKIEAQQLTGNIEWDVYENTGVNAAFGHKKGFWERLDPSLFDSADLTIPPESYWVTILTSASGIGWNPAKNGPGKHPTNFAEFFDTRKFPGRRALRARPNEMLEMALLADGVPPKDIYPLDIDRAFKVLDRIKPSVAVWVGPAATQTIAVVQAGEVDFTFTNSGRVKATTEPGGGTPLAFSFEQNLFNSDVLAVVKGAPNKENAMKLVAYFMRPEAQVGVGNMGFLPVSKKSMSLLSPEARKWQTDLTNPNSLLVSDAYWADHLEVVSRRFKEWILA